MGAFFGASWMLWFAAAAAIPVLIHLFARQRFRRVNWAAMDWLLRAFKKQRRRIRLEQLLLLILRILAILLFVLALAEPLLDTGVLPGGGDRRRDLVIILDDSFSMGLQAPDGGTPFVQAREQAVRLVRALRQERGDTVTLVTAGRPATLVLKEAIDPDKVAAEIEKAQVGDGASDLVGAFTAAVAALEDLRPGAEVWLLSDLQKTAFAPPAETGSEAGATPGAGGGPPAGADDRPQQILASLVHQMRLKEALLYVLAPREMATDNLAVTSVASVDKAAITGVPLRIAVTVRNFGTKPQRGVVQIFADGGAQPVDFREIESIPPGAPGVADFRHTFTAAGSHTVEARFLTDSLAVDNRRALALDVRDRIRVLVVDGDPKPEPGEQESFFLVAALDPGTDVARPAFATEVVEETRFDLADLSGADLLVLMNVGLISRKRSEDIQRFVEQGGGLLVFLGDRTQPATLNGLLWKQGAGTLPAEILDLVGRETGRPDLNWSFGNADFEHPALAYFGDPRIRHWLSLPPVYRFHRLRVGAEQKDTRVMASLDQPKAALPRPEPGMVEKATGKGKAILVATSGDQDWTDLPAFPTWLLLSRELAFHLTRREARLENVLAGQTYHRILRSPVNEVVLSRDGEQIQILKPLPIEGGEGYELRTPPLARSGLYRLDLSGQPEGRKEPTPVHVAVNVDTLESDLARVGEDYVRASFPSEAVRFVTDLGDAGEREGAAADGRAWWWALMLALAALAAETTLSQIFGLRTRGEAA